MKRKGLILAVCLAMLVLILYPAEVNAGSKSGLLLWFRVVLPALVPFLILSGLILRLGVAGVIGKLIYPVTHLLFGLSEKGSYALVVGWLSGMPVGAKSVADLYLRGEISQTEANYLLTICNLISPMFLLEYIGVYCMDLKEPVILLVVIYLAAVCNGIFQKKCFRCYQTGQDMVEYRRQSANRPSVMQALDESISDSFVTITRIGGYIILFSVLTRFVKMMIPAEGLGDVIGLGLVEITTGGELLRSYVAPVWAKWMLGTLFAAFGGLSGMAQTYSVLQGTELSMKQYIRARLCYCAIACVLGVAVCLIRMVTG